MKYCLERKLRLDLSTHYNVENLIYPLSKEKQESFMPLVPITRNHSKLKQNISNNTNDGIASTLHDLLQQKSQSISLISNKYAINRIPIKKKKKKGTVFKNLSMKIPSNHIFHNPVYSTLFQNILQNKLLDTENKPNIKKKKLLLLLKTKPFRYTPKLSNKRESDTQMYSKILNIKAFKAGSILFDLDDDKNFIYSRNTKIPSALSEITQPTRKNTNSFIKYDQTESNNKIISVTINKR